MHRLLGLLIALVLALPADAQDSSGAFPEVPKLVVSINPQGVADKGSYVNGQIVLQLRVLSRFPFETLDLRLPEIDDVQHVRLLAPRTRYRESYGGAGYVHETVVALFPKRSGPLTIPPITLHGSVETSEGKLPFADQFPGQTIQVLGIDPSFAGRWWLVSEDVKISEHWSIPPAEIRYGDIVRREVSIVVSGVTDDYIPVLEHRQTRGIEVSDDGRTVTTKRTAAGTVAHVTQAWRIRIGTNGFADIPPLGLAYWHPTERQKRYQAVPGRRLEPLPIDTEATATRLMAEALASHNTDRTLLWLLVAALLLPVGVIGAVALWTVFPSRADVRLIQAVWWWSQSDLDRIRATESWARDVRITLDTDHTNKVHLPQSVTGLRDAVYGKSAHQSGARRLSGDLMRLSRQLRLRRVLARVSRF